MWLSSSRSKGSCWLLGFEQGGWGSGAAMLKPVLSRTIPSHPSQHPWEQRQGITPVSPTHPSRLLRTALLPAFPPASATPVEPPTHPATRASAGAGSGRACPSGCTARPSILQRRAQGLCQSRPKAQGTQHKLLTAGAQVAACPAHPILSCPILSHPIPVHSIPSCPIPNGPVPSRSILYHPILSHSIHPIPTHSIPCLQARPAPGWYIRV